MSASGVHTFPFGAGRIVVAADDGAVIGVDHPAHPGMRFLLGADEQAWHHAPFAWGKGYIITERGSTRWDQPAAIEWHTQGVDCSYRLLDGLHLFVERRFGAEWTEAYRLTNTTDQALAIGALAISTPFRDVYHSAADSLRAACHAHVWTGGAYSFVWAVPMNGSAPGLGLAVTEGTLWSYSIETRNQLTSSHVRGHIYLHVTDAARAPHLLGDQPVLVLAPGETYTLAWRIGWFDDVAHFERAAVQPPVIVPSLAAPVGTPLLLHFAAPGTLEAPAHVTVTSQPDGCIALSSDQSGVVHIDVVAERGRARIGTLFHPPVQELVERRIRFVLDHQRPDERDPLRRGAFVPYDNRWGLRVNAGNWTEWSDGRERIAMPLLLQQARRHRWGAAAELDRALHDFDRFCRTHLVDNTGAVFEDSFHRTAHRLYNFPWLATFFLEQSRLYQRTEDRELAVRIIERYYDLDGDRFLAIGLGDCVRALVADLAQRDDHATAGRLRSLLLAHADHFVERGHDLPVHEVNYEQLIVAPLLELLLAAYALDPQERYAHALRERLPWLLAFGGPQPHVRLRHIAIRHWDGYWFGASRQWGDVFPHYWSVLTAAICLAWPAELAPPADLSAIAHTIYAANLVHFADDGSATCAFSFPGCVDGNPAHAPDPLANDQDWALVYYLRATQPT
jgi:hypothetical protein